MSIFLSLRKTLMAKIMKKILLIFVAFAPLLVFGQNFDAIIQQADQAYKNNEIEKAKNLYIQATFLKQSPKAYLGAGDCYLALKQTDSALVYLKKAYLLNPNNPEINFKLGLAYFTGLGNAQKALEYFKQAETLAPDSTNYQLYKALAYQALGDIKKAFNIYQNIMQTDTANAYPYYFLGEYMYEIDSLSTAYRLINQAIAKNPKNYNFYLLKGSIEFKAHLYANALQTANQGLKYNPNSNRLLFLKAQALYELQKYSEAIPILEKLLLANEQDLNIYFYLGWSYYYTGQYDKALDIATDALKKNNKIQEFYQLQAYAYIAKKDYIKAQRAADKMLQIEPSQIAYNLKITAALFARTPKNLLTSDNKFTKFNALNIDYIKSHLNDPNSDYYYKKLQQKFEQKPDRLSLDQYLMLYLGYSLNHKINRVNSQNFIQPYTNHKYQLCITEAQKAISAYPLDQAAYLYLALAYKQIQDYQNFLKYLTIYHGIQKAIVATGDGMTDKTAYLVTNKDDIYYTLTYTGGNPNSALSFGIKSFLENGYQVYKVSISFQPKIVNNIYFLIFK